MAFRCTPPTKDPVATLAYRPWELAIKPFQVAPQTWYVAGQTWVGCYLIDTGDGLILIDTAIAESAYMLVDSIYRLGYRPDYLLFRKKSHIRCPGESSVKRIFFQIIPFSCH